MTTLPTPRQDVLDLYWRFAYERQMIYLRRLQGQPGPWTDDPVLGTYRFCNAYRAADRVSQYLIRDVAYRDEPCTPQDRLFQILAFRFFSKEDTWDSIRSTLKRSPVIEDLTSGAFLHAIEQAKQSLPTIYTSAFILCATNAYDQDAKHKNHVELFKDMFVKHKLGDRLLEAPSLRSIFNLLQTFPLMGPFMSYQIATDLNYSDLINFSENDFTKAGPGALRGIAKVFRDRGRFSNEDVIQYMVNEQHAAFERLELDFPGLFGRPLHAIDIQNLFCEVDKYCRVARPDLKSARTRIKSTFVAKTKTFKPFFPPKWNLNLPV